MGANRTTENGTDGAATGILVLNKPTGVTSRKVVDQVARLLPRAKVGHAGTLDPLATGLLILCTGKYTKKINDYMAQEKEYTGMVTLGAVTPTYDLESMPEQEKEYAHVTQELVEALIAERFLGEIWQTPPIHSAIKKDGKRVYELARQGKEVKLDPRRITIKEFVLTDFRLPVLTFRVVCTTGTYIRSLANDLGASMGCGGYLSGLCRTRIGEFRVDQAMSIATAERYIEEKFAAAAGGSDAG